MKRKTLIVAASFTVWILGLHPSEAQNATRTWFFGHKAAFHFNPMPLPVAGSALMTSEGSSSISDSNGDLLFYTDGQSIWNKNHVPMPNGTGLTGHSSSTQSALIVPCDCSNYFVFTTDASEHNNYANGLRYSVVDMTLNGGLGDVVATKKNVLLLAPAAEKLAAVSDGANGYWVVGHAMGNNRFVAYRLTGGSGCTINPTPVTSNVGTSYSTGTGNFGQGQMKISPDGTKLAAVGSDYGVNSFVELFAFNKATGQVSNFGTSTITVQDGTGDVFYGVEFSPSGNMLYVSSFFKSNKLIQYDISANVLTTKNLVNIWNVPGSPYSVGALQLAGDGRIYVARPKGNSGVGVTGQNYLSVISKPDLLAAGNNAFNPIVFADNGVTLPSGSESRLGLPAMVAGNFSCSSLPSVTPTPTPFPTPTPTPTPAASPTATAIPTSTPKPTPVATPTPTPTSTSSGAGDPCCPPWNSLIWGAVVVFFLTSFRGAIARFLERSAPPGKDTTTTQPARRPD